MTIGPMPPHPGLIRDRSGGAPIVSVTAPDAPNGDPDGFAQALMTVASDPRNQCFDGTPVRTTVERFDERGFFANAGALPGPVAAPSLSTAVQIGADACHPGPRGRATPTPDDPFGPAGVSALALAPPLPGISGVPGTRCGVSPGMPGAPVGQPSPVVATPLVTATPVCPPAHPDGPSSNDPPIGPVRASKPHQPATVSEKIPVSAVLAAGDDAAAVTISAHGLSEREINALRADIVALLRRHGLTLDDLRLNGRPLGQGRHDQSGN